MSDMPRKSLPDDLADASLEELREHQKNISGLIERRLEARKQEALDAIRSLVREHGLGYDEVVAVIRTATKRGKAPAIYRNPDNPRQTWSGKGEPPSWYTNHPKPESLRIPGA